jgi:carbon monoxide dehydrogenase subunit G
LRIEESIEVAAPSDRVWRLVEDPRKLTRLDAGLTVESDSKARKGRLRDRYRVFLHVGPVPIGSNVELVELDPGRDLAWTSLTGVDHRLRIRIRERDGGTRVVLRFGYSSAGPFGLLADLASYGRVRAIAQRLLAALREEAERP